MAIIRLALAICSDGGLGLNYWKFTFPGFSVGSLGTVWVALA